MKEKNEMSINTEIKYDCFWIINSISNFSEINNKLENWSLYTSEQLVAGKSPLGKDVYQNVHLVTSLYNHCFWLFYKKSIINDDELFKINNVLKYVFESFSYVEVSKFGCIVSKDKEFLTLSSPVFEEKYSTRKITTFDFDLIKRQLTLVDYLYDKKLKNYISIFEYLREIKKSDFFISQLALWTFLEHHWADDKIKTDISKSLPRLLKFVFEKNQKHHKNYIERLIKNIGESLGKEYNEKHLRHILAHGKHYTLKENWTNEQWQAFSEVHEKLFEIVLLGIEKEIYLNN